MIYKKKYLPVWIKEPTYVFFDESKRIPVNIAKWHAICFFSDNINLNEKIKVKIYEKRHRSVYQYLERNYYYVLQSSKKYSAGSFVANAPIWLFWWQGEENMPELVKKCKKSVLTNRGKHPVILITKDNFFHYVNLPDHIIQKLHNNAITLTHFSDILRVNLIADYGGFWLDATIFCSSPLKEEIFIKPIFTGKNPGGDKYNISQWRWTGYAIYGWKNNILFCILKDLFNEYWRKEKYLIDYYLIDYMICFVYNNVNLVRSLLDDIQINNKNQNLLQEEFNQLYTPEKFDYLLNNETWLYKLTWKQNYSLHTSEGRDTMYYKWCQFIDNTII